MSKTRAEAFSDGVFAIVITLLILDIRVPDVDYSHLADALVQLLPRVFAYVVSFGVIGVYWFSHHRGFQLISKMNDFLIWWNILYLLFVSFMPFPTALLGRYPLQPLPILIYGANLILANLSGLVVTVYLRFHPELSTSVVDIPAYKMYGIYIFVNGSYVIAMVLGFFAPLVSYVIFAVVLVMVIVHYASDSTISDKDSLPNTDNTKP